MSHFRNPLIKIQYYRVLETVISVFHLYYTDNCLIFVTPSFSWLSYLGSNYVVDTIMEKRNEMKKIKYLLNVIFRWEIIFLHLFLLYFSIQMNSKEIFCWLLIRMLNCQTHHIKININSIMWCEVSSLQYFIVKV